MITQMQLDAAVREAYNHAHACCHYGPTDRSFPVGEDGIMDCTGLMLRALWWLGLVNEPLNCDQINARMGQLGFFTDTTVSFSGYSLSGSALSMYTTRIIHWAGMERRFQNTIQAQNGD